MTKPPTESAIRPSDKVGGDTKEGNSLTRSLPSGPAAKGLDIEELEAVAAHIEGSLSADERERFSERLVRDEALFDAYVSALQFHEQEERGGDEARRSRRWVQAVVGAAAAALLLIVTLRNQASPVTWLAEQLAVASDSDVASTLILTGEAWEAGWSTYRSTDAYSALDDRAILARLAARLVDLQLASHLQQRGELSSLVLEVESLCAAADEGTRLRLYCPELDSGSSAFALSVADSTTAVDEAARDHGMGEVFKLAQWAELGRLASRFGKTELLESRAYLRITRTTRRRLARPSGPRTGG